MCIYVYIYIYYTYIGGLIEYISQKVAAYGQFVLVFSLSLSHTHTQPPSSLTVRKCSVSQ